MGLTKAFIDSKSNKHISYSEDNQLTGTAKFASLNTHNGVEQSRRDDLEGLAYNLIYFMRGNLPWDNVRADSKSERYEKIKHIKGNSIDNNLCEGIPKIFHIFLNYCRELKFEEKPDYDFIADAFVAYLERKTRNKNVCLDWASSSKEKKKDAVPLFKGIVNFMKNIKVSLVSKKENDSSDIEETPKNSVDNFLFIPGILKNMEVKNDDNEDNIENIKEAIITLKSIKSIEYTVPDDDSIEGRPNIPRVTEVNVLNNWG